MNIHPMDIYSTDDLSLGQEPGFSRQAMNAQVSTQTIGVQLGKLGISLSAQSVSVANEPAPVILQDFAREIELQFLIQHVTPFQPKGTYAHNATMQRLGASAYALEQGRSRSVAPMISTHV